MGAPDRITPESSVSLQRITAETLVEILALQVSDGQKGFVADNAWSIAEAHFDEGAWFRAIYADETPVGFVLLHDESLCEKPRQPGYLFLWRMMIDQRYQRMGFGRRGLRLVTAHVKSRPDAKSLHTSWRRGEGSAQGFYEKLGFCETGEDESGEVHAVLDL
jgi:diamine N-acetyltransferase